MNNLVSTAEAQNGFYPTPKSVAYQLFDMIDTQPIREVLEPSAGKGDLLKAFGCYKNEKYQESLAEKGINRKDYNNASCNVDAIEFDPNLRGILNYEFCGQRVQEFNALLPYLNRNVVGDSGNYSSLSLKVGNEAVGYTDSPKNKFINLTRHKYWTSLLNNEKFTGMLTKNLKDKYSSMISKFAEYDFTMFNIQTLMNDMNSSLQDGIEKTILDLFEKFSFKHTYIDGADKNIHYYNGWKTNKAHIVNKKVILPCNGAFSDWKWDKHPLNVYNCVELLSDIQKALNYLDGGKTEEVNLNAVITKARDECNYRKIETKYFYVTFCKRGTMHLIWRDMDLLKRFNIYASRHLGYLPPTYGNKHYNDMTEEEKQVIDSFQGADDYEKIMRNPSYYLSTNTNLLQITG